MPAFAVPSVGPPGVAIGDTVAVYAQPAARDATYGDAGASFTAFTELALEL